MCNIEDAIAKYTDAILMAFNRIDYVPSKLKAIRDYSKEKTDESLSDNRLVLEVYDDDVKYRRRYEAGGVHLPYTLRVINDLAELLYRDNILLLPKEQKASRRKRGRGQTTA